MKTTSFLVALAKLLPQMEKVMKIRILVALIVSRAIAAPGVARTVNLYIY